jgi:hypothetical protein
MKIALVGPGIMEIPPPRWGAVEMVIWDCATILRNAGHSVSIINTPNTQKIIDEINNDTFDIVHLHYDVFAYIMPFLKAKVKIISSHYPFINNIAQYKLDGYDKIIEHIINNKDFYIFASSQKDIKTFTSYGADVNKTFLCKLGVESNSYSFETTPTYNKTVCFSQIVDRKRQHVIQSIDSIDFIGRYDNSNFTNMKAYKGEFERKKLNNEITKYSNFILLSKEENTTPLVVKEALICGLGVVVSEAVAYELDTTLDFISVIEENKIHDLDYIQLVIEQNKKISILSRDRIRSYGINNFDISNIILNEYLVKLESLLNV